jgi:hypothetical protein
MNNLSDLIEIIESYINFIDYYKNLLNTHNVQFIIENHWSNESIINLKILQDLNLLIQDCNANTQIPNLLKLYAIGNDNNLYKSIEELFNQLKYHDEIWNERVLTSIEKLPDLDNDRIANFETNFLSKFSQLEKQNRFMNEKKTYEVDLMSKFVAKLCKSKNINTVSITDLIIFKLRQVFLKLINYLDC